MPELAEKYPPNEVRGRFRRQAWIVWGIALGAVVIWLALIVAPPFLITKGMEGLATQIYAFYSYICHQKPERSFYVLGYQLAVCSRCFGVYFGLLAGTATYPIWRNVDNVEPLPRIWLFLSLVPIGIDWTLGVLGIWENTFASRFITGMILGSACAVFVIPALVEIVRNLTGLRVASAEG
jgi:uncharacterized membrane protein